MAASKKARLTVLTLLAVLVVGAGLRWWFHGRYIESTDNAYVRAEITAITSRVAGEIVEVAVQNNQPVKKGDLLLRIDAADYQARVANARAAVAVAAAALVAHGEQQKLQQAMIGEARASLAATDADRTRAQKDYQRAETLVAQGVATHARLDTATAQYKASEAQADRARAGVTAARQQAATLDAERARLKAQLQAAEAQLQLAELDLAATELRAPRDGVVGDLAARQGERINANLRLLSLVPLDAVYVEANFKETQLTTMAVGQRVRVEVDAFPGVELEGRLQSLSPASGAEFALLPPDNASGNFNKIVQRVPVKIAFVALGDLAGRLRPGMSVEVAIDTRDTGAAAP